MIQLERQRPELRLASVPPTEHGLPPHPRRAAARGQLLQDLALHGARRAGPRPAHRHAQPVLVQSRLHDRYGPAFVTTKDSTPISVQGLRPESSGASERPTAGRSWRSWRASSPRRATRTSLCARKWP